MRSVACRTRESTPRGGTGLEARGAGVKARCPGRARDGQCREHEGAVALAGKEDSLLPVVGDHIDDEVRPLARCEDEGPGGLERRQGLAVQRHDPAFESLHSNREDTRVRHVCETKAKALVAGYRPGPGALAIDGDPVPAPPPVRPVAHRAEALFVDPGLLGEPPVVEEKHLVAVHHGRAEFLDDERAVEPARHDALRGYHSHRDGTAHEKHAPKGR